MSENYISKIKKPQDWSKDFCLHKVNLGLGRGVEHVIYLSIKSDTSSYVSELSYTMRRVLISFQKSKVESGVLWSYSSLKLSPG